MPYNPWNFGAEPGDIMVAMDGRAFRLYTIRGSCSAAAGELCAREIKRRGCNAMIENGQLRWVRAARGNNACEPTLAASGPKGEEQCK
jgi:hypothetical protein